MKKLVRYTPTSFLLFLIIGIILQFQWNIWCFGINNLYIFTSILFVILFLLKWKNIKISFSILSSCLFVLIGISILLIQNPRNRKDYYLKHYKKDCSGILTIQKILKPSQFNYKFVAKVSQINSKKTSGHILLNISIDTIQKPPTIGDQLYLYLIFQELPSPLNPYQFDYKSYLAKQHIYHQVFTKHESFKTLKTSSPSFYRIASNIRDKIKCTLKKYHFSKETLTIINALLLGERQQISKELLDSYTKAGAIHILAISGLHIGVILWFLSLLFSFLERYKQGRFIKTALLIGCLWSFAFIAGLSASVVRATTMFSFVSISLIFKRKQLIEHSLISSMLLLLLINPLFLFDVGFQLSYLAVFGIVWIQPLLYALWKPKYALIDKFWQLFTVSIAAQTAILPLSLYYFNQFPMLFILSNLLIIPFLATILISGIIIILLALTDLLPTIIVTIYEFIISSMNSLINWIGHQEAFLLKEISLSLPEVFVWYLCIILFFQMIIQKKRKLLLVSLLLSIIGVQFILLAKHYKTTTTKELIVFHKTKSSLIGVRNGRKFLLYYNDSITPYIYNVVAPYKTHKKTTIQFRNNIPNVLSLRNDTILLVDSLGIYNITLRKPIVILQYSPKINLTRLITRLNPKIIVVDGSNYKSYINRWEATCEKEKTPFYNTRKNGAYILKY
ncbi:Competence protein [Tenacibaculum sp. 190130A14a]|uniref:Competence protein ComEC n=1 Tax=Tenacibaculum polynesiense TaxID=3137857 RepID=A0ABM9PAT6_9FLAO